MKTKDWWQHIQDEQEAKELEEWKRITNGKGYVTIAETAAISSKKESRAQSTTSRTTAARTTTTGTKGIRTVRN